MLAALLDFVHPEGVDFHLESVNFVVVAMSESGEVEFVLDLSVVMFGFQTRHYRDLSEGYSFERCRIVAGWSFSDRN